MATRRRGRALIIVVLILILLLILLWAVYTIMLKPMLSPAPLPEVTPSGPVATSTPVSETVEIVMTSQLIPRGKTIDESVITLVPIPVKDYVQGTFFENPEDVIGKRAKYNLDPATPLTASLVIGEEGAPASFDIPKGMVAISVPISTLSSVSYALQPGDHVDMIVSLLLIDLDQEFQTRLPNMSSSVTAPGKLAEQFTLTAIIGSNIEGRADFDGTLGQPVYVYPGEEQRPRLVSQTLIRDVMVLHVGLFPTGEPSVAQPVSAAPAVDANGQPVAQATPATPAGPVAVPDVMTIVVTPQDAVTINYLLLSGARLNYVMRNPEDTDTTATQSSTLQFILDQYSIVNPAKLPYGTEPRTDNFMTNNNTVPPFPDVTSGEQFLPTVTPVPATKPGSPTAVPPTQ